MTTPTALETLTVALRALGDLSAQQGMALAVFASYFGLIGWLASKVLTSIREAATRAPQTTLKVTETKTKPKKGRNGSRAGGRRVQVFWALTVASFAHTWYCESLSSSYRYTAHKVVP